VGCSGFAHTIATPLTLIINILNTYLTWDSNVMAYISWNLLYTYFFFSKSLGTKTVGISLWDRLKPRLVTST
jgi:hypothetical protein